MIPNRIISTNKTNSTTPADKYSVERQWYLENYGFVPPQDFFDFYEFSKNLRDHNVNINDLGLSTLGMFDFLSEKNRKECAHPAFLHMRYYNDSPEFFTILGGESDGQHWGYHIDADDDGLHFCVLSYFNNDAYQLTFEGYNIFQAFRVHIEQLQESILSDKSEYEDNREFYDRKLKNIASARELIIKSGYSAEQEAGQVYFDIQKRSEVSNRVETRDGFGVINYKYRDISTKVDLLLNTGDTIQLTELAKQEVEAGFAGCALFIGKQLWPDNTKREAAVAILSEAYQALGIKFLSDVALEHFKNRDLLNVDILREDAIKKPQAKDNIPTQGLTEGNQDVDTHKIIAPGIEIDKSYEMEIASIDAYKLAGKINNQPCVAKFQVTPIGVIKPTDMYKIGERITVTVLGLTGDPHEELIDVSPKKFISKRFEQEIKTFSVNQKVEVEIIRSAKDLSVIRIKNTNIYGFFYHNKQTERLLDIKTGAVVKMKIQHIRQNYILCKPLIYNSIANQDEPPSILRQKLMSSIKSIKNLLGLSKS